MDTLLFKWHMKKNDDTNESLAKVLDIHPHTLYLKSRENNDKQEFTQSEIQKIIERYNLTGNEVLNIFFKSHANKEKR